MDYQVYIRSRLRRPAHHRVLRARSVGGASVKNTETAERVSAPVTGTCWRGSHDPQGYNLAGASFEPAELTRASISWVSGKLSDHFLENFSGLSFFNPL